MSESEKVMISKGVEYGEKMKEENSKWLEKQSFPEAKKIKETADSIMKLKLEKIMKETGLS